MGIDPGMQSLFMLLRNADIAVGLEEIRRLGTVFAAAPELDEDGLGQVIAAVVVKSAEQRMAFQRIYKQWLTEVDRQLDRAAMQGPGAYGAKLDSLAPESAPAPASTLAGRSL